MNKPFLKASADLDTALAKAEDFCRQQAEESEERLARWAREDAEAKRDDAREGV